MPSHWAAVLCCCLAGFAAHPAHGQQPPRPPATDTIPRDSRSTPAVAVLIGRVTDSAGTGLASAEITLDRSDLIHTITNDSGSFRIAGLAAGTNVFNVRRIGFQAATFTAILKPGKIHRATFALTVSAHELPAVAVSDTASDSHWLDLFDRRRGSARGTFFTRADIVRHGARSGTDIVRTVPGVRLAPTRRGSGSQVVMTRGAGARACIPAMFVHNMPYSGTLDDFTADDVEALEVYVGISEIPPELDKNGRGMCGAIVVWTRDPHKAP